MQALRDATNTRRAADDAAPAHKPPPGDASAAPPLAEYPGTLLALRNEGPRFGLDDFDIGKRALGQGQFGKVYKAKHRDSKRWLVLKVLEKQAILDAEVKRHIHHELEVHSRMVHPNILRMFAAFQDPARVFVVLEFANKGTLYEKLQKSADKTLCEAEAACYVKQLCRALESCHARNVVHRDIKPENLLLFTGPEDSPWDTLKLADFGYAIAQRNGSRRTTLCGTVEYLPPEVVDGEEYDFPFDMWCVGVLAFEMLAGVSPFFDASGEDAIYERIRDCRPKFDRRMRAMRGACDLIARLLVRDPAKRMTAAEVLAHPWVVEHTGPYEPQACVTAWVEAHGPGLAAAGRR